MADLFMAGWWVLVAACVVLCGCTIVGLYREIDELRDQVATAQWQLDNTPGAPPVPALVDQAPAGWLWRAFTWVKRTTHRGGHRA